MLNMKRAKLLIRDVTMNDTHQKPGNSRSDRKEKKEIKRIMDRYKKNDEFDDLEYFLSAYSFAPVEELICERPAERPDFICKRPDGEEVGVELTRLVGKPTDWNGFHNHAMLDLNAEATVQDIIQRAEDKGRKILEPDWKTKKNVLVFQLYNIELSELAFYLNLNRITISETLDDLTFEEVWIADFRGDQAENREIWHADNNADDKERWKAVIKSDNKEAFGEIELFGLYPAKLWGLHENPRMEHKPFG